MKILIVGAGLSGLAASYRLKKLGHDVEIYEASDIAGGRARLLSRPNTDDWSDVGSQYFHSNYKIALQIIDELGLTPKLKKIKGNARMFSDEKTSYLVNPDLPWLKSGGIIGNLKMGLFIAKLMLNLRSHTFAALPEQEKFDRVAGLSSTLDLFLQDHIVRMLTLVGGLSEPSHANVSLLQIYRLIKIIMFTEYVSLEGGTATLHAALAENANIHFNRPVKQLLEGNSGVCGIELEDGEKKLAEHVIVATEAPVAAQLISDNWKTEKAYLKSIDMPPAIIVSFFIHRSLEEGVWNYFMPMDHSGPVTFCVDTQQKSPGNTPSGQATLQAWIINPASANLINKSDEELGKIAKDDILRFLPDLGHCIEGFVVTRHSMAVPQATVGHNAKTLKFLKSIDRRDGVSFCGDYLSGGYMESALWSVQRAVTTL